VQIEGGDPALLAGAPIALADIRRDELRVDTHEREDLPQHRRRIAIQVLGEDDENLLAREHLQEVADRPAVLPAGDVGVRLRRPQTRLGERAVLEQLVDRLLERAALEPLHHRHPVVGYRALDRVADDRDQLDVGSGLADAPRHGVLPPHCCVHVERAECSPRPVARRVGEDPVEIPLPTARDPAFEVEVRDLLLARQVKARVVPDVLEE